MATRFDVCIPRPKRDGGTYWHKIGAMYPNEKGGFSIRFDSLPIPNDKGDVMALAFEPKDLQGDRAPSRKQAGGGERGGSANRIPADMDDSIPFAPER